MRILRVFFVGLLYGWFLRWIVDQIFLEDKLKRLTDENTLLQQHIQTLEARKSLKTQPVQPMQADSLPIEQVQPIAATDEGASIERRDDLKLIKGIGPQFEKKLNAAGIYTFDDLSRLSTSELQSILGRSKRAVENTDKLIKEAKKFAGDGPKG